MSGENSLNLLLKLKKELQKLLYILSKEQKLYGGIVFVCSLLGAFLEVLGVGIILPLVQAFMDPDKLMENKWIQLVLKSFGLEYIESSQLVILITVGVIILFLIKNLYFIFLSWIRIKFSCKVSRELSTKMMSTYMKRGYEFFLNHNTADLSRNIGADVSGVDTVIYQMLRVLVDSLTIFMIVAYIMLTDWVIALAMVIMALLCLLLIYGYFRVQMREAGRHFNKYNGITSKYLLQALHGIKEILVMHKQEFFIKHYEEANREKQKGAIKQTVGAESPAYIIEGVCVAGLLAVVCIRLVTNEQSAVELVPALSAFAMGAFRILPSLGRISSALNTAIYYMPSLNHVYENLQRINDYQEKDYKESETGAESDRIILKNGIDIENISWHYKNSDVYVIHNLNLTIKKGTSVAFVGQSGAGKTTLADIILGLLEPQEGKVLIDGNDIYHMGKQLGKIMGYVPQTVYLTDDTIRNNVAFGIEGSDIDDDKVWDALEQAQLKQFVKNLNQGLDTFVGDRGVRFSGGQRQRIAIARALYENPDIIIFDEATAALDNETELAVMESIHALQGYKTIIIIAHRLTTIKDCDEIYEISDGKARSRKYEELTSRN
ncbi:ABC transporter ATP-binding protein [Eisenbergiella tayi]|uniref:ABC transporter ATP-binding protein n=1 Tax=Eisenbergiella tayi TaxID=1432052 RepID=UPI000E74DEE1|nr:ABC transporter ATP-binding protein [Eisenbergiella tayi]MDT4535079.1 ABC transporter ATP-binding protein [Eisenbergiella tayi]RJW48449.1 ABC transporter ATP-binding protein [Lachnospiraceae bacterium OM02-31]RJW59474.1 ABC transporter ATP-binding protein [Lachnospiraceae bacterium OM02-3]